MLKKYTFMFLILIASNLIVIFLTSNYVANSNKKSFNTILELLGAENKLMHYKNYRDIAIELNSGKPDLGVCLAELYATVTFKTLKSCIDSPECNDYLSSKENAISPELLKKGLPFKPRQSCSP